MIFEKCPKSCTPTTEVIQTLIKQIQRNHQKSLKNDIIQNSMLHLELGIQIERNVLSSPRKLFAKCFVCIQYTQIVKYFPRDFWDPP